MRATCNSSVIPADAFLRLYSRPHQWTVITEPASARLRGARSPNCPQLATLPFQHCCVITSAGNLNNTLFGLLSGSALVVHRAGGLPSRWRE